MIPTVIIPLLVMTVTGVPGTVYVVKKQHVPIPLLVPVKMGVIGAPCTVYAA